MEHQLEHLDSQIDLGFPSPLHGDSVTVREGGKKLASQDLMAQSANASVVVGYDSSIGATPTAPDNARVLSLALRRDPPLTIPDVRFPDVPRDSGCYNTATQ